MWKAWFPLCGLLFGAGCSIPAGPADHASIPWEGELHILAGDTVFVPCGQSNHMPVTGPGVDSLARRYNGLKAVDGQWIKTWCNGYALAIDGRPGDSMLVATGYLHMDAEVHCPPIPVEGLAGSYLAVAEVANGQHTEQLEFMPDGRALIITSTPDLYAEEDGHWGSDNDGDIVFTEAAGRFSFYYGRTNGGLVRPLPARDTEVAYRYTGPADELAGAHGRISRLLAATANAQGMVMDARDLRADMPLDSLFPDEGVQVGLKAVLADSLDMDLEAMDRFWGRGSTVGNLTKLMRTHLRTTQEHYLRARSKRTAP